MGCKVTKHELYVTKVLNSKDKSVSLCNFISPTDIEIEK